ncbi:hypothetical protein [Cupriavidus sp. AU9028]|uniref:hypothetical protein n=1 Tax=Cupriavidus sp. AU9028 TaxID=2871157 RepID=UPI001C946B75|nr:hypothetical protein [Cupriavidus sp. AU9028]MBY4898667.1 hypothetical protein [Cupriavidus sp. AU9028]
MPQKGFTAIVNKLHIRAKRVSNTEDVSAGQSEAQFFDVYQRGPSGNLMFLDRKDSFDSALDFCLAPTLH